MTDQNDFEIKQLYEPTAIEKKAITELKQRGLNTSDWESHKSGIKSFKDNILKHMYYEQDFRCAYCRIEQSKACSFLQREHIVPKSIHPQWMFEPRNICFTCDRCNNSKGAIEVLSNPDIVNYPTNSSDYLIVNPFLDKYSDHIELKGGLFYSGKTSKGKFTIRECNLSSPEYAMERAKRKMAAGGNPDKIMTQFLHLLSEVKISHDEWKEVKRDIENIVTVYKKRNCLIASDSKR